MPVITIGQSLFQMSSVHFNNKIIYFRVSNIRSKYNLSFRAFRKPVFPNVVHSISPSLYPFVFVDNSTHHFPFSVEHSSKTNWSDSFLISDENICLWIVNFPYRPFPSFSMIRICLWMWRFSYEQTQTKYTRRYM